MSLLTVDSGTADKVIDLIDSLINNPVLPNKDIWRDTPVLSNKYHETELSDSLGIGRLKYNEVRNDSNDKGVSIYYEGTETDKPILLTNSYCETTDSHNTTNSHKININNNRKVNAQCHNNKLFDNIIEVYGNCDKICDTPKIENIKQKSCANKIPKVVSKNNIISQKNIIDKKNQSNSSQKYNINSSHVSVNNKIVSDEPYIFSNCKSRSTTTLDAVVVFIDLLLIFIDYFNDIFYTVISVIDKFIKN